jgi:hypothetical protein
MDKSVAEKALEGSLLSKLGDPRYFIMFAAFGLYWDSYSHLTSGTGLLRMTYTIGDAFPLGSIFVLIAGFSLLASYLSPAVFWICNHLFWDLWFLIPDSIRPGQSTSEWSRRFSGSVSKRKLKLWAIKTNSSLAMSLAKDKDSEEQEIQKNRPHPFLLVLCISANYFFTEKGILRAAENALPTEFQHYFFYGLLVFSALLLYTAFAAIPGDAGYIHLPGLKEHIEHEKG